MLKMIVIASLAIGSIAAEMTVPKGATEVEPGVYKYTEAGKTYTFRKTPFGIVKSLDEPAKNTAEKPTDTKKESSQSRATPFGTVKTSSEQTDLLKVTERGDMLEFEHPSPFGPYRWKRNKNELTATERQAWERSRKPSTTSEPKE
jgi:hypothetical protein